MNRNKAVTDIAGDAAFWEELNAKLKLTGMTWARRMTLEGVEAAQGVGVVVDMDAVHQQVERYIQDWLPTLITRVNATTIASVQSAVNTWVTAGLGKRGLPDLVEAIRPIFGHARATRIAVTEATRVFAEGNRIAAREDDTIGGLRWDTARDELVCPICQPLDGKIYQIQGTPPIPRHVNCLPGDTYVTPIGAISAGFERWYEGDVIFLRTAAGDELTATPNHPILTDFGWLAAKFLKPGINILRCLDGQRMVAAIGPNDQNMPTAIKKIVRSLVTSPKMALASVPSSAIDFHGDGGNSKVNIVWTTGNLWKSKKADLAKIVRHKHIQPTRRPFPFIGFGPQAFFGETVLASLGRNMGGGDLTNAFFRGHPRPFEDFGLGLRTDVDSEGYEAAADSTSRDAEFFGNGIFAHPGLIEMSRIISVDVRSFVGHVYNLQTESGTYIGNNIITHNCRCSVQPVTHEYIKSHISDWMGGPLPVEPIQVGGF